MYDIYRVQASLAGSSIHAGRPVINNANFLITPDDTVVEPDDFAALARNFGGVGQPEPFLLAPDNIVRDLGRSVVDLANGAGVAPYEYWQVADRPS